eukprot:NODE_7475_length_438_cov_84.180157.p2 GENE.NODE_7475_length_438_cov_84.180157~~NODE_7475_length_438_cov_84.180157.p2  ORF type:complete len:74 (-),score=32.05 NODE_7475_length_438_cov_84.180157:20-241(-)
MGRTRFARGVEDAVVAPPTSCRAPPDEGTPNPAPAHGGRASPKALTHRCSFKEQQKKKKKKKKKKNTALSPRN